PPRRELTVRRFADDAHVGLAVNQHAQPAPEYSVIIRQEDPKSGHGAPASGSGTGTRATTVVPFPGPDSISISPPASVTRSRIPTRPRRPRAEAAGSIPTPSSSMT